MRNFTIVNICRDMHFEELLLYLMVVYNALLEGPLSNILGGASRWGGEILTTGTAAFAVVKLLYSPSLRRKYKNLLWPVLLLGFYAIVQSIILAVHPVVAIYSLRGILRFPFVTLFVAMGLESEQARKRMVKMLFVVGGIECILLVMQNFTPGLELWEHLHVAEDADTPEGITQLVTTNVYPSGTFPRYNHAAEFVLPIALLAISEYILRKWRNWFLAIFCCLLSAGVFVTCSRTAQLILLLGIAVIVIQRKLIVTTGVALSALLLLAFVYGKDVDYSATTESGDIGARFLSLFSESYWDVQSESELERLPAAVNGIQNLLDKHPLLGTGLGTVGTAITNSGFSDATSAPYEDYNRLSWLEDSISLRAIGDVGWVCLLAQLGVVGFVVLIGMYFNLFRNAYVFGDSLWRRLVVALGLVFAVFESTSSLHLSRSFLSSGSMILGMVLASAYSGSSMRSDSIVKLRNPH